MFSLIEIFTVYRKCSKLQVKRVTVINLKRERTKHFQSSKEMGLN